MFGGSQRLTRTGVCPLWHHNGGIYRRGAIKRCDGKPFTESCISVFNMTDSCWHVKPTLSWRKIWCQFIPLNNHHRGGGGGPNTHDAAHLTNIWLQKQEAKIDCQVWCATELNISRSESGCRRLRHHRKLSVFGQEVSSFRRAPPIPASNYKQLQKHSSPHGNAAVEGVIDQLEASQHGVQVSVCVHSHRSWRLKTRIFSLHLWRTLFSGLLSPLFVQKEVSVLAIFLNHLISTKLNFICGIVWNWRVHFHMFRVQSNNCCFKSFKVNLPSFIHHYYYYYLR